MATPSPEEALRILEEHIAFVEAHPDEFPAPKDASDLVQMNMEAHQRELDEKFPGARHDALVRRASHFVELGDLTQYSDEDLLASVVRYTSMGDYPAVELDRVYAECVAGDDRLEDQWEMLTAQESLRADFHIDGDDVEGHAVEASSIVDLIRGVDTATASTAKAEAKKINDAHRGERRSTKATGGVVGLRLVALSPGSFEFTLEAPKAPAPKETEPGSGTLGTAPGESIDDRAFLSIINALYSDGDDDLLKSFPAAARRALLPAARVIARTGLNIQVKITQRGKRPVRRTRDIERARTLVLKLEEPDVDGDFVTGVFRFDGYKESTDSVFLMISDSESRRFKVEDPNLLGQLKAVPKDGEDVWLDVRLQIIVTKKPGSKTKTDLLLVEARTTGRPSIDDRDKYESAFVETLDRLRKDDE